MVYSDRCLPFNNTTTFSYTNRKVIGASMLSGLSAALTQRALVGSAPRHALFFSAELAMYGILFLVVHMHFSANGRDVSGD